jgi:7-cyano-7-deazaguanine synthase in queuosine biosynthesis
MPTNEHLALCGGAEAQPVDEEKRLDLNLHGSSANVRLEIEYIGRRLPANLSDAHADLLEVASYIYAADRAISRGGEKDTNVGALWRRKLRFVIPVRQPNLWSSDSVAAALVETISFLSEDDYKFEFRMLGDPLPVEVYFQLSVTEAPKVTPGEVILFSGGLDSFAGTVEQLVTHGRNVALVSHRSAPKITGVQNDLVALLRQRFGADRILHVPFRANVSADLGKESTRRTRSFLFAAIGAVTAQLLDQRRIRFFENGVTSLNLPPVGQVVGARASRTTHPQTLAGFRRVLAAVFEQSFDVSNPYVWMTKAEVIGRVAENDCRDLIKRTRSCARVQAMTRLHPHCGKCSQCIDRRFAILAAGQEGADPGEAYKVDLFLDGREPGPDREMALSFVRSASMINQMTDVDFFARYGETSRIVSFFQEPAATVDRRIFDLHGRHATAVCNVFDDAIRTNAARMRVGILPPDCLISLIVSGGDGDSSYPAPIRTVAVAATPAPEIRLSVDESSGRVQIHGWGELRGANARLIVALAGPFRDAVRKERAPEEYPFLMTQELMSQMELESDEVLRRRVLRCRNEVKKLARNAGGAEPSIDAVIESSQWHGYRLNPDRVRIVSSS